MANFFLDNKDLQFHLQHPLMRKIVELKERGFAEKTTTICAAEFRRRDGQLPPRAGDRR